MSEEDNGVFFFRMRLGLDYEQHHKELNSLSHSRVCRSGFDGFKLLMKCSLLGDLFDS